MTRAASAEKRRPGRPAGTGRTREQILETTISELATNGFYGTTVRTIAEAVGVTTASLLHHFATKEALYSEVLARIAESLEAWPAADTDTKDPKERVALLIDGFFLWVEGNDAYSRILLRELMDNVGRAAHARRWHLAPVTRRAVDVVRGALDELGIRSVDPEMLVFQLIGAVVYFFVSLPTAERILGTDVGAHAYPTSGTRSQIVERFRRQLRETTLHALAESSATGDRR